MLIRIHEENPSARQIKTVVEYVKNGGVIIFPTDTIYAMAADIYNPKALQRIAQIKGIKVKEANFSFLFYDLSQLSEFVAPFSNEIFKLMKSTLPGPFTYILKATNKVPKIFQSKKKTLGIRIPENNIVSEVIKELGNPLLSTSIHADDEIVEYLTDPELIYEKYYKQVDLVIDGGFGNNEPSTVLDCTGSEVVVLREGKGVL